MRTHSSGKTKPFRALASARGIGHDRAMTFSLPANTNASGNVGAGPRAPSNRNCNKNATCQQADD